MRPDQRALGALFARLAVGDPDDHAVARGMRMIERELWRREVGLVDVPAPWLASSRPKN